MTKMISKRHIDRLDKGQMAINSCRSLLEDHAVLDGLVTHWNLDDQILCIKQADTYEDYLEQVRAVRKSTKIEFDQYSACWDLWLTIEWKHPASGWTIRFFCQEQERALKIISKGKCKIKVSPYNHKNHEVVCEVES